MKEAAAQLIDGEWIEGNEDDVIESVNPANVEEVVGQIPAASREQAQQAIEAAVDASEEWRARTPDDRDALLYDVADLIEDRLDELAETMTQEEGKAISSSRAEVSRTAEMFRYFAGDARRATGDTVPSNNPDMFTYTVREPLGVVSLITPWNFPIGTPGWKIAPALAAGNAVVFKPSSVTPVTGKRLTELLVEAGIPDGVVNFVVGAGSTVGAELTENEGVAGISFTGSTNVGRTIGETAGRRGIPFQTEMGGNNPLVVLQDADLDAAVDATITGAFGGTGQACTATSRAIVHEDHLEEFTDALIERSEALEIGPGIDDPDMGPVAYEEQFETNLDYVDVGQREGAELLTGGEALDDRGNGYFMTPTIFGNVESEMRIAQEEVFGPFLSVLSFSEFDEAVELANDVDYGLSASIFTGNMTLARQFVREVEAGVVKVNGTTSGSDIQMPFGGMKASSSETYKELGQRIYQFYTHEKAVYQTDPS